MIMRRSIITVLPVVAFAALGVLFWKGLSGEPSRLPSPLINRQAPQFSLPPIAGSPWPGLATADLAKGKVTIVNIFASWCQPCRAEHPLLMDLAKRTDIDLVGINNKDTPENAIRFLNTLGNPYAAIGADETGRTTIDWGGYGVPETFIVDGTGLIRHKIIGGITPEILTQVLVPEVEKAKSPATK
jgi:cytochrome c biogenesis protein CcmG, thiol:disulfide interchange protein DsbE